MTLRTPLLTLAMLGCLAVAPAMAQGQIGMPSRPLPDGPFELDTAEQGRIRVTATKGLENPWDLAFLPNGDLLVTERPGRLRIVRGGVLDPQPISGVPELHTRNSGGLMSVVVHPRFAENGWVYMTYTKSAGGARHTSALARGRLAGMALTDVRELFVADAVLESSAAGLPLVFGTDGYLYMGVGGANDEAAQRGDNHLGKVLRFRDDGSVPENPFAGRAGFKPEIYTIGHRNMIGMTIHPTTGAIWQNENGPLGGDEVNILKPGANYGWPLVSYGRQYSGGKVSNLRTMDGVEDPELFWNPSIAISGMTFYSGDRFPQWRNNLFVGGLQFGRIPGTGQIHRIAFNEHWEELRREALFVELRQRIRDVEQGPDGLLYVLTDERDGALLRFEPGT